jgi:MFS transporter, ACS family, hexuronate transporter
MTAMLIIAIGPLCLLFTQYFGDISRFGSWASIFAIGIISLGAAAHQAWSANLFTTVSDMFPKKAVGSVVGIGGMAGGMGGVSLQLLAGRLTDQFSSHPSKAYLILFLISGFAYLFAWLVMNLLVPKMRPVPL